MERKVGEPKIRILLRSRGMIDSRRIGRENRQCGTPAWIRGAVQIHWREVGRCPLFFDSELLYFTSSRMDALRSRARVLKKSERCPGAETRLFRLPLRVRNAKKQTFQAVFNQNIYGMPFECFPGSA